jgi:transposase InsO family protein
MDIVGPLPVTCFDNRYILTMCDTLTRWAEAVVLPNQNASMIARAIVDRVAAGHGVPQRILTDQGANFESELVHTLCRLLGIRKVNTTAYHPQGNGHCEKFNGTLSNIIATMTNLNGNDWDEALGVALFHYRTKIHTSTGVSPFHMTYGREPRCIPDLKMPLQSSNMTVDCSGDYLATLEKNLH